MYTIYLQQHFHIFRSVFFLKKTNIAFSVENWNSEQRLWILLIQINTGTKFQLKLTILIFWTKFSQKAYCWLKAEKLNIIIEFCIFQ